MVTRPRARYRRRPPPRPQEQPAARRSIPPRVVRLAQREAETATMEQRIADRLEDSLRFYAVQPEGIERRLRELDEEWSIERILQSNGSALALAGAVLAIVSDKRWLLLSALASGVLLQYAAQGWCPPVRKLRSLGIRMDREIAQERYGLKALRGDFESLPRGKEGEGNDNAGLIAAIMKAVRH